MKIITDPRCVEYSAPGHPERPQRVSASLELFRAQKELPVDWLAPLPVEKEIVLRAHAPSHLARLGLGEDFDQDTPSHTWILITPSVPWGARSVPCNWRAKDTKDSASCARRDITPPRIRPWVFAI